MTTHYTAFAMRRLAILAVLALLAAFSFTPAARAEGNGASGAQPWAYMDWVEDEKGAYKSGYTGAVRKLGGL